MMTVRAVIGESWTVNVTEHVDRVRPIGLTILNVTEHGGQEIGTVGAIVTGTGEFVSEIEMYAISPNHHTYVCNIIVDTTQSTCLQALPKSNTLVVAYL